MYARSGLVKVAADKFDEVVRSIEEELGPRFRGSPGFRGFTVVGDREHGQIFGISFWATKEDREAAHEIGDSVRQDAAKQGLDPRGDPPPQLWEVVYYDMNPERTRSVDSSVTT